MMLVADAGDAENFGVTDSSESVLDIWFPGFHEVPETDRARVPADLFKKMWTIISTGVTHPLRETNSQRVGHPRVSWLLMPRPPARPIENTSRLFTPNGSSSI